VHIKKSTPPSRAGGGECWWLRSAGEIRNFLHVRRIGGGGCCGGGGWVVGGGGGPGGGGGGGGLCGGVFWFFLVFGGVFGGGMLCFLLCGAVPILYTTHVAQICSSTKSKNKSFSLAWRGRSLSRVNGGGGGVGGGGGGGLCHDTSRSSGVSILTERGRKGGGSAPKSQTGGRGRDRSRCVYMRYPRLMQWCAARLEPELQDARVRHMRHGAFCSQQKEY